LQPAVRIELSDTGEGISPEVLSRLFEPFLTTKVHGSGFGLFTSYKIIEAHSGRINVESQVGLGTTFSILLPVEPA
jgi:signal transduction histidine kinase